VLSTKGDPEGLVMRTPNADEIPVEQDDVESHNVFQSGKGVSISRGHQR